MGLFGKIFGGKKPNEAILKPGRGWTFEVVGESQYQSALATQYRRLGGNGHDLKTTASLCPDDNNPHDVNAVRIELSGQTVGYLKREAARIYRESLGNQPSRCGAKIVGGFELDDGTQAYFGVKLNLSWPPKLQGH